LGAAPIFASKPSIILLEEFQEGFVVYITSTQLNLVVIFQGECGRAGILDHNIPHNRQGFVALEV
jgi:hypothetical protein